MSSSSPTPSESTDEDGVSRSQSPSVDETGSMDDSRSESEGSTRSLTEAIDNAVQGEKITLDALLEVLRSNGVSASAADVIAALGCTDGCIAVDDAHAYVKRMWSQHLKASDAVAETDAGDAVVQHRRRVKRVGLVEYLAAQLPCARDDEGVTLVWDSDKTLSAMAASPKTQLAILSAGVLMTTVLGILLVFSFAWRWHAESVSVSHLEQTAVATRATFGAFQSSLTTTFLATLQNNAESFGPFLGASGQLDEERRILSHGEIAFAKIAAFRASRTAATQRRAIYIARRIARATAASRQSRRDLSLYTARLRSAFPAETVFGVAALTQYTNGTSMVHATGLSTASDASLQASRCLRSTVLRHRIVRDFVQGRVWLSTGVTVSFAEEDGSRSETAMCVFFDPQPMTAKRAHALEVLARVADASPAFPGSIGAIDTASISSNLRDSLVVTPASLAETPCTVALTAASEGCESILRQMTNGSVLAKTGTIHKFSRSRSLDAAWAVRFSVGVDDLQGMLLVSRARLLEGWHRRTVATIDYLNFAFTWSTEVWVGWRQLDGVVVVQANAFRFATGCLLDCNRLYGTVPHVLDLLQHRSSGNVIQGDYRPQPVVTGYTAVSEFDAALLVDRDVVDVNDFALQALISIVNTFNSQNTGGIRVALIRANERPLSETFSPDDPCPRGLDICVELPGLGVAFRSDCRHCVRFRDNATDFAIAPVTGVNGVEGDAIQLSRASRLFQLPFTAAGDVERTTQPNDGSEVIARGFWLANYSCGVSVSHALNSERAAVDSSNATVGGASVVGLLTAGLLLSVTRYLLRGVETEWRMTKRRIAEDRRRFVSHVRDFMPEFLAPQMSKRFPAVWYAASAPLSVVFLEMCHMSEVYRTWQPTLLARFVSYQRIMLDSLLVEYSLHHVQMIGDQAFVIAGMDEDAEVVHHTFRAALFAASLHRLSNPAFAHFPGRCPALVKSFGTQVSSQFPDVTGAKEFVGCVKMPHYRVGIHLGECTTAVKPISGSPHFDVYGPAVGVALAIERKCHHGQILVSGAAKDAIEAHGGADVIYTRQGPLVTTQGKRRVATHVVSRARAPLPHAVMHELGIRPSVRSVDCLADDRSDTMTTSYAPSASTVDQ